MIKLKVVIDVIRTISVNIIISSLQLNWKFNTTCYSYITTLKMIQPFLPYLFVCQTRKLYVEKNINFASLTYVLFEVYIICVVGRCGRTKNQVGKNSN